MTKGVLLFASNTDAIRYTDIAENCAARCKKYLNVPVSVVSSTPWDIKNVKAFDTIISVPEESTIQNRSFNVGPDDRKTTQWKNFSRSDAYNLTPYDETLVIDVDYLLFTDKLKFVFEQDKDFVLAKHSQDLSFGRISDEFKYLGLTQLDFYWATVFFFRKTIETQTFFNLVAHIRDNWIYYKQQYQFSSRLYRNDFSFTIAAHILKEMVFDLPFPLHYITDKDIVLSINDECCKALVPKKTNINEYVVADIRGLDLHIMNKIACQELL